MPISEHSLMTINTIKLGYYQFPNLFIIIKKMQVLIICFSKSIAFTTFLPPIKKT